ncbi:hypothetical protein ACTFIU_009293 [Dictyostelium citrinum]
MDQHFKENETKNDNDDIFSSILKGNEQQEEEEEEVDDVYFYSKTVSNPSIITHCVGGNFRNSVNDNDELKQRELVFIKDNCLEILEYFTSSQSLESINHQPLFSIVKDIKVLTLPLNSITNYLKFQKHPEQQQSNSLSLSLDSQQSLSQPQQTQHLSQFYSFNTYQQSQQQQQQQQQHNFKRNADELKYFDKNFKKKDFLILTSDSGYLSVLSWSNLKKQFLFVQHFKISPPGYSFKYLGEKIQISPCNRVIGVCALKKKLSIFLVNSNDDGDINDPFSIISKQIEIDVIGDVYSFNFTYDKEDLYYSTCDHLYIIIVSKINNNDKNYNFNNNTTTNNNNSNNTTTISTILTKYKFNFSTHKIEKIVTPIIINPTFNYEIITLPNKLDDQLSSFNFHHYFLLFSNDSNQIIFTNSNCEILKIINVGKEQIIDYDDDDDDDDNDNYEDGLYDEDGYKVLGNDQLFTGWSWYLSDSGINLLIGNERGLIYNVSFKYTEIVKFSNGNSGGNTSLLNEFAKRFDFKFNPIQSIINLKDDYFFVLGDLSDGGIFKFNFKSNDPSVEMIETLDNHGGIIDFDVHKQMFSTKIYSVCGGSNSIGSVKVIENSIPTTILGDNKLNGIPTNVWCFNPYIIIGLVESTLISQVDGGGGSGEPDNLNFLTNQPTIYCCRTSNGTFLQVTPKSIILYNCKYNITHNTIRWNTMEGSVITNSCSRDNLLLVSISKPNKLLSFTIKDNDYDSSNFKFTPINDISLDYEISCISLPHFDHSEIIDFDNQLFNTCCIGNYSMDIILLDFKLNKLLFSLSSCINNNQQQNVEQIEEGTKLTAIPHSILLSILNRQPLQQQSKNDNQIKFKLLCGLRDGKLLKWDLIFNLKLTDYRNTVIEFSSNLYSKIISNSPISIIPVMNHGAIVLTNLPYYITSIKNHLTMIKISYKDDQMVSGASLFNRIPFHSMPNSQSSSSSDSASQPQPQLQSEQQIQLQSSLDIINGSSKLEFIFINPDLGFSLVSIDFSKKISIRKIDNSITTNTSSNSKINNRSKQNPNRILFIEKYKIIVVLGDTNLWVLTSATESNNIINNNNLNNNNLNNNNHNNNNSNNNNFYKEIYSTKDNLNIKSGHSIKYWSQKNLIIVYGTDFINQSTILFYSVQLNGNSSGSGSGISGEDVSLTLEKTKLIPDQISSVLPISNEKYMVFTTGGNLLIDYNNGRQINLEDTQNSQILTPHPITISKFNQSTNKIFLATELNGSDIYSWTINNHNQNNNNNNDIDNNEDIEDQDENDIFNVIASDKSKYITDALFLSFENNNNNNNNSNIKNNNNNNNNNLIATVDKYGNFKILNLNQKHKVLPLQQQQQQDAENVVPPIVNNFMPVILDPVVQFSLKETCMKLYQLKSSLPSSSYTNNNKIITCSLLGSVIVFGKLSKKEYRILNNIQQILKKSNNTRPLLNNDHQLYRSELSFSKNMLDGDLLFQFLFLDDEDQLTIINSIINNNNINNNYYNNYRILSKIISLIEDFDNY